ncbi:MAG: cyclic nucleotide-binding domain-containing protein [bacterium]|nr:cyclic nucleotide-binding domain-containing protein [bacterium]
MGARVSALSDGLIEPLAVSISGILVLLVVRQTNVSTAPLAAAILVIIALWVGAVILLIREYPRALKLALKKRRLGDPSFQFDDQASQQIIQAGLNDLRPEAVVYALHMMGQTSSSDQMREPLIRLLNHPSANVRIEVLRQIEIHQVREALPMIDHLWRTPESPPAVKVEALRTIGLLADDAAFETLVAALDHPDSAVQQGAMIGLLRSGGLDGVLAAGQKLLRMVESAHEAERETAALVIGAMGSRRNYAFLLPLLDDPVLRVRLAALGAAGKVFHPRLGDKLMAALERQTDRAAAAHAFVMAGAAAFPVIQAVVERPELPHTVQFRLIRVIVRMRCEATIQFLARCAFHANADLRTLALNGLLPFDFRAPDEAQYLQWVRTETELAARLLSFHAAVGQGDEVALLKSALELYIAKAQERVLLLLSYVFDPVAVLHARDGLRFGDKRQRAYALERIDTLIPLELKGIVLPLIDMNTAYSTKLTLLSPFFPQARRTREQIVHAALNSPEEWLRVVGVYTAGRLRLTRLRSLIEPLASNESLPLTETAAWTLEQFDALDSGHISRIGVRQMLSIIEKVIVLKTVDMFAQTPDDVLAEVAQLLGEVRLAPGEPLFEMGDLGTSMYIVVTGQLRVHDGDYTLDLRNERQVVGEMALLDPEPRTASVTAVEETLLFRLDQEPFFDLMMDRSEVMRGILRVITASLRARVRDLAELRARVQELERERAAS